MREGVIVFWLFFPFGFFALIMILWVFEEGNRDCNSSNECLVQVFMIQLLSYDNIGMRSWIIVSIISLLVQTSHCF